MAYIFWGDVILDTLVHVYKKNLPIINSLGPCNVHAMFSLYVQVSKNLYLCVDLQIFNDARDTYCSVSSQPRFNWILYRHKNSQKEEEVHTHANIRTNIYTCTNIYTPTHQHHHTNPIFHTPPTRRDYRQTDGQTDRQTD